MKSFDMEMEGTSLDMLADTSLSILTFAMKQRLKDEIEPTPFNTTQQTAERETAEYKEKLESLKLRLYRGWQLISSKLES